MPEDSSKLLSISVIALLVLVPVLQTLPLNLPPLLPEASAQSTISINNVQTTHTTTASSSITLSSFNAGTGSNRTLVVAVESESQSVSSITFGGTTLKQASGSFHNDYTAFWYLTNPSGTANIVVTMNANADIIVGAYALSGVDPTNPIPTTATNYTRANSPIQSKPTISLTTQYPNSVVLDSAALYGGSILSSPSCTNEWHIQISSTTVTGASSSKTVATPGAVTCKWTNSVTQNGWDDTAIEVKAAGTSAPATSIVLQGKSTATGFVGASGGTVTIYNFNPGSGSNRLLMVGVAASTQSVSSIKFGTVSLTQAVSSFYNNDAEF